MVLVRVVVTVAVNMDSIISTPDDGLAERETEGVGVGERVAVGVAVGVGVREVVGVGVGVGVAVGQVTTTALLSKAVYPRPPLYIHHPQKL